MQTQLGAHRKTTPLMDTIDRKSIHHRGFSYVHGARLQFFEMPLVFSVCVRCAALLRRLNA